MSASTLEAIVSILDRELENRDIPMSMERLRSIAGVLLNVKVPNNAEAIMELCWEMSELLDSQFGANQITLSREALRSISGCVIATMVLSRAQQQMSTQLFHASSLKIQNQPNNEVAMSSIPKAPVDEEFFEDLFSHHDSFRKALVMARDNAATPTEDTDDRAYWQHQLDAFDRIYAQVM
jgi:hypothetical protein